MPDTPESPLSTADAGECAQNNDWVRDDDRQAANRPDRSPDIPAATEYRPAEMV